MNKILRGRGYRYPFPKGDVGELELLPTAGLEGLGFRLVHDDALRVNSGGSWRNSADFARAANRFGSSPGICNGSLGFRLVRPMG